LPELPEVETVVRTVGPFLRGRRIESVEVYPPFLVCRDPDTLRQHAPGRTILEVRRNAKHILVELSGGWHLGIHLGMTGRLLAGGQTTPHTRVLFVLDRGLLLYDDPRMFGRVEAWEAEPLRRLGPDAMAVLEDEFVARMRARRKRMKSLLLDQAFVGGIGNIYADEILYWSGVHPRALSCRLSEKRARLVYGAMKRILGEAIDSGGSSVSDYVDATGQTGWFQIQHRVYRRTGEPCGTCGTPIRRILEGQRGTHYCPKCQRV
jgi:formamidopyrimidine-DNA glycosylase